MFTRSSFNNGIGYYLEGSSNVELAITNIWKRESNITNSNIAIMENSSIGKSTL